MSSLLPFIVACAVCFQADGSDTTVGMRVAIVTLVAVTTGVLSGFGVFAVRFIKRGGGL